MLYVGTQNGAGRRVNLDTGATELFTATPTCGSWGLGVTPDERFLYLVCSGEGRVDIMDIASRQVVRQYSGYSEPRRVALSDDGTIVVVATASALCDLSLGASSAAAFGTRPTRSIAGEGSCASRSRETAWQAMRQYPRRATLRHTPFRATWRRASRARLCTLPGAMVF
jgi:DNA-binding beta-propeller fold protein YncE